MPFTEAEVASLVELSDRIDALWAQWAQERVFRARFLRQPIRLWGQPSNERDRVADASASQATGHKATGAPPHHFRSVEECEEFIADRNKKTSSGARLKAVMDYWGALWFWPVLDAAAAPTRAQWLGDVQALLEGGYAALQACGDQAARRWDIVQRVTAQQRFFHWELTFVEVFATRGGMDVFLGNPPWVKVEWKEAGVLGDIEPLLNLRKHTATQVADKRKAVLEGAPELAELYLSELGSAQGQGAYIASGANYPLLRGVQGNLYKCFLERVQKVAGPQGTLGIIHQKGLFDDPRGGALRAHLALHLRVHLHFINKLLLFAEIEDQKHYELSVIGSTLPAPAMLQVSNLFHPRTLDESIEHDGKGPVPGIKNENNNWDLRGHRSRIVQVDDDALQLFAKLYDPEGTPAREARLPLVHSREILEVLRRFAEVPRTLGSLSGTYYSTEHFHQTNSQKDGTIREEIRFPKGASEWIVSGPHFYVGTPFNKTPNEGCRHNQDYSPIDLTVIADDYLPRTNYVPACSPAEYRKRTPHWNGKPVTDFYRHVHRKMLAPTGERTLVSALCPPGPGSLLTAITTTFVSQIEAVRLAAYTASIPLDFLVKSTGRGDLTSGAMKILPFPSEKEFGSTGDRSLVHRALRLNCLTTHYAALWQEVATAAIAQDGFAKSDPRLPAWSNLSSKWTRDSALRTPFARRQALVELDALAALSLGLTLDQLLLLYRVQFPVLQQYERDTFFDQRGKIVFTTNRGLSGVGLTRKQWEEVQHATAKDTLPEWAVDEQGSFVPPFDRCDREADMAQAYHHFQSLLG